MWIAPLALLGLLGLAIPLWLHRFARKTDTKHAFASLMFLEPHQRCAAQSPARAALLAAVAAAPAAAGGRGAGVRRSAVAHAVKAGAAGAALHVIVVDTSLSMQYAGVWDRARAEATALVGKVRGADRMMLVAADHRLRVLKQASFAGEAGAFRAALGDLTPGESRLDYGMLASGATGWGAGLASASSCT